MVVSEMLKIASAAVHRTRTARGWAECVTAVRRNPELTGAGNALNAGALAAGWPTHAIANLRRVHVKLSKGAAESVAVHAKLFRRLALVAFVVREHLEDVALLELTYGIRVGNAGAVHLRDESVQFALQGLVLACSLF